MTSVWIQSIASVLVVSLASLLGLLALSLDPTRVRRLGDGLVAFAVGALLGDAFLHLVPETLATGAQSAMLLVLTGMLLFFALEKLLLHRHSPRSAPAIPRTHGEAGPAALPELAAINLVGDALHNFVDGSLIAASFLVSTELGLATVVAVVCHEIPQELGDFGVLVHSGLRVRRAALLNLLSAAAAMGGAVLTLLAGALAGHAVAEVLVPIAAGGFVYIAAANLVPELQRDRTLRGLALQAALIGAGIAAMALLTLVE